MIKRFMKGDQINDLSLIRFPVYASPKIDGFRCGLDHQHAYTSRLGRFPNEEFHQASCGVLSDREIFLDGEVVVGRRRGSGVLQRTSSGLTSVSGIPDATLWVFDVTGSRLKDDPWLLRYEQAKELVRKLNLPWIKLLKHKRIRTLSQLERYVNKQLKRGFEGVMIRNAEAPYKEGRATLNQQWFLKIKPFKDSEARITGYFEEMENTNEAKKDATGKSKRSSAKAGKKPKGTLGGFIGKDLKTKSPVRVGGGFTKKQRADFWLIKDELVAAGAVMKYKSQATGEKDNPRHSSFIDLRPGWDIAE